LIGSISEKNILDNILKSPDALNKKVGDVMSPLFPRVDLKDDASKISALISKENSAVIVNDESGQAHILTQYDLIHSLN
jgi:cystathionine beta-synthase